MSQGLLDLWAAQDARDEAIVRVGHNATPDWFDRALDAVLSVCVSRLTWICDDVWDTGLEKPAEARALGAVITTAKRKGWCAPTGEYRPSAQAGNHANPRQVWRSTL